MSEPIQKMGKGMIIASWVLILTLLTLFFQTFLDKQNNPNQQVITHETSEYLEVILQRNRSGHYVASGHINRHPVVFFLDTGATTVSIPENVANTIGLQKGRPMLASTANGTITTYDTRLNSVGIGDIELSNVRAGINPHMGGNDVLLGMSFLKHLEFTQRGDTLILRQYQ